MIDSVKDCPRFFVTELGDPETVSALGSSNTIVIGVEETGD